MIRGTPDEDWLVFHRAFQRDAHQLLAWGYYDARRSIEAGHGEEKISKLIVNATKDRLDRADADPKYERYFIEVEVQVRYNERAGKECPRIDISIECSALRPRPHFVFEAKRLKTSVCTIGDYTGDEGMKCYIRGEYALGDPAAAMLGYIQNSTVEHWLQELKRVLGSDSTLGVRTPLRECRILDELPHEWLSVHSRGDEPDIDIFHIFLDCS